MSDRIPYVVHKANIKDDEGTKKFHGEVASLSPKLARHYNSLGFLRPHIPDGDEEVDDDDEVENTTNGTGRTTSSL